jgi:hippurate hydrolase
MQGTIRSFNEENCELMKKRIREICEGTALAMGCKVEVTLDGEYPAVINHKTEADHVQRIATKWFGPEHVSNVELPVAASEDFSYFIENKPGCFFALGTLKPGQKPMTLHTSNYDFNDDMIATGAYFWIRLVEDRLNISIL